MYVYYSLDREGFIEQLCENKDKPELNCNGKCMLMQMLRAQAEDDEPMPVIGWEDVLVFFMERLSTNNCLPLDIIQNDIFKEFRIKKKNFPKRFSYHF